MRSTPLFAAALSLTSVLAQSTVTTSFFIPYYGGADASSDTSYLASVVSVYSSTTEYAMQCHDATTECDPPITYTVAPSLLELTYADYFSGATAFTLSSRCEIDGTTAATCTESAGGSEANFPGLSTTTYTSDGTEEAGGWQTITVTAGAELLGKAVSAPFRASSASLAEETASKVAASETTASTGSSASNSGSMTTAVKTGSTTPSAATATSTGAAVGHAAFGVSAVGVLGIALAAIAL